MLIKRVGLVGWNGKYNVGDDAMTAVIVRYMIQQGVSNQFHFFASKKALAHYTSSPVEVQGIPLYNLLFRVPLLRTFAIHYIFPYLFSANKDMILFGGGSIIHRAKLSAMYLRIIRLARRKNSRIRIGAIGISVGPFSNHADEKAARSFLETMDFFVVRDQRSAQLVHTWGLKTPYKKAPDLALMLPGLGDKKITCDEPGKYIGISLRSGHVSTEKQSWLKDIIIIILQQNPEFSIRLFEFCVLPGQDDRKENKQLLDSLPAEMQDRVQVIPYSRNPVVFYQEISCCRVMLCMRLHAAIISYAVNTKFMILSYHQKCVDFAEEIGLPAKYLLSESLPYHEVTWLLQELIETKNTAYAKPAEEILSRVRDHFFYINP